MSRNTNKQTRNYFAILIQPVIFRNTNTKTRDLPKTMMNDDEEEKKIRLQILKEHSDTVVTRMISHALKSFR